MPKISVVIVTFNQKPHLNRIFESIEAQPFKDLEVIVADDGGSVSLMDVLRKNWSFPIKYYWHKKSGWCNAKCRNMAARIAEGEYIFIIDGDTLIGENTFTAYLPHLDKESLLWGQRQIINPVILDKKITDQKLIDAFIVAPDFRGDRIQNTFSGANFILPRDKFLEVLWNERITYYGYDDYEFFDRWIYGHQYPASYIPGSVAYHFYHPAKPGDPAAYEIWQETRERLGLA